MSELTPTPEQDECVGYFLTGDPLVIEALAGTGKTSTLELISRNTERIGTYVAFNRAIVQEAQLRFPMNITAVTAHGLAMRAVGRRYHHRLPTIRAASHQLGKWLDIGPVVVRYDDKDKTLAPGYLAGLIMKGIAAWCASADEHPSARYIPFVHGIDSIDKDGRRKSHNNDQLRAYLEPKLEVAWADLCDPDGRLPFTHDHYLKMWQLSGPSIPGDFVLFDEAQDATPVMLDAVAHQASRGAQLVFVGDTQQQIYEWRGAINALAELQGQRAFLTQSWRFGEEIADVANVVLAELGSPIQVIGHPGMNSRVGACHPTAVLCRSNVGAIDTVLKLQRAGRHPHLVGGGAEVVRFAKAVHELQETGSTYHPELACFDSWAEVQQYCVDPWTPILTADLGWVPALALEEGSELVGFDEECAPGNSGRRYRPATVTSAEKITRPCRRLWMQDGREVVVSSEHRWLVKSGNSLRWKRADMLRPGDEIASLGTWDVENTRDAGWLAGMFDGEGWSGRRGISLAQREGPVLERARRLLKERGVTFGETENDGMVHLNISGSLADRLYLLGTLRPERLIKPSLWVGMRVEARSRAVVRGIEDVGEREVVALGTSSRTFVANGLLSHNCEQDPQGDELALMVHLIEEYGLQIILDALDGMIAESQADVIVSTAHKSKGREWEAVRLAGDFAEPLERGAGADGELRLLYVSATRAREVLDIRMCQPLQERFANALV